MKSPRRATAIARANIALAKYWGKSDVRLNLPAVPSISMTLDALVTTTTVELDPKLAHDRVTLDDRPSKGREYERIVEVLDRLRKEARIRTKARVTSANAFPTAAGLASSASGFAALVAAAREAMGLERDDRETSRIARWASASAARSVYGGFVELPRAKRGDDSLAAKPLFDPSHWDLRMVIALATYEAKAVGSTEGMERSRKTSPLYDAWIEAAPRLTREVRAAIEARDLPKLGRAMEQSTMSFHSTALSSSPPIVYWTGTTLGALAAVRALRDRRGIDVYATMDAGPHVKALCRPRDASLVRRTLARVPGVLEVIVAAPGRGLEVR
jgi:diphosphomevalonate decarboxylase